MRTVILIIAFSTIFILVNAEVKCKGKKFKNNVKKYEKCRAEGFKSKIEDCTVTTKGKLKKKQAKKCAKSEKGLKHCGYTCTDPVHGGWTEFGDWSECSAECDGGSKTRSRTCTNPAPQHKGADCRGNESENRDCNTQDCPVDGG